jgi:hypothetical protein
MYLDLEDLVKLGLGVLAGSLLGIGRENRDKDPAFGP